MAEAAPGGLADLLEGTRSVALVGLAKNTGKTETLAAILRELEECRRCVGVTSIGRDGEAHDVIDARISKPRIVLREGSLVASTDALVRASGLAHELLERTGVRTPLGEVVVARLAEGGAVEVAGPSAGEDLARVSDTMLSHGAGQVLIDGSIDRRAASSPTVADGLVIATGAVLGEELEQVVAATRDAVELVRLPLAGARPADAGARPADASAMPADADAGPADADAGPADIDAGPADASNDGLAGPTLARRLVLGAEPGEIAALLREHPRASTFHVEGALSERFLEGLLAARTARAGRELRIVVGDPTKVFLTHRGAGWYRRQGLSIEVRRTIELKAITVNPIAPQSHRFDSRRLRELIEAAIPDVPVLDVLDPSYLALAK
ncbi:MAG: hypothetical protein ACRDNJ_07965 [Solirubrobacteraceae bacterium]